MTIDWAAASALGVSGVTLAGTVYTARSGRRTNRQERRDDFTTVTDRMEKELQRFDARLQEQERETDDLRDQNARQELSVRYLAGLVRTLVGFIQASGLTPPPAPQPIPDDVRPYLHDLV